MRLENESSWSTPDVLAFFHKAYELVGSEAKERVDGSGDSLVVVKHWSGPGLAIKVKRMRTAGLWEFKIPRPERLLPNVIERLAAVGANEGANNSPEEWRVAVAYAAMRLLINRTCDTRHKHRTNRDGAGWSGEWGKGLHLHALPKKLGRGSGAARLRLDIARAEYDRTEKTYALDLLNRREKIKELHEAVEALEAKLAPKKLKRKKQTS